MAIGTMLHESDRMALLERLRGIRPDSRRRWGSLDAPRMLCHVADQMRVALGDLPSRPAHTFLTRTLLKTIVVDTALEPPRGKIRTAPEMLTSSPAAWEADLAACTGLAARVGRGEARAVHPTFGPLSPVEWARLTWKHLDYHLRQFGA